MEDYEHKLITLRMDKVDYEKFCDLKRELGFKTSSKLIRHAVAELSLRVQARKVRDQVEGHL